MSTALPRIAAIPLVAICMLATALPVHAAEKFASHPPLGPLPEPSDRPLAQGPAFYVDPAKGSEDNAGTKDTPWKSIVHALKQIGAGDTLYLRGGTYYEWVYCAIAGTAAKPITIRVFPGEMAVVDGSFREFAEHPQLAWEPVKGGAAGEYRSTKAYKNLRNIHGRFADSMVGLQVYYHIEDLRGQRYVGPGDLVQPGDGPHSRAASALRSFGRQTGPYAADAQALAPSAAQAGELSG